MARLARTFLAVALASSLAGCSQPTCRPSTCSGCCDIFDRCLAGTVAGACGANGDSCVACQASQVCRQNVCRASTGGGQGGGTSAQGGGTGQGGGGGPGGGGTGSTGGGAAASVTVSGVATYDFVPVTISGNRVTVGFAQSTERPVRDAVVQVLQGTQVRASGTTSATGQFSLTYTPQGTGALRLVVFARSTSPSITVEDNTDADADWGMSATLSGASQSLGLRATHGWTGTAYDPSRRIAAPFAILDSMYTAARAFLAVRPAAAFPALKVNWSPENVPQSGDKTRGQIGTSSFDPRDGEIYILGAAGQDTDEFDAHVIVHEWGHYFENAMSRSDSPGGPHSHGEVLDPRLAFGEGWGNAVASMVLGSPSYVDSVPTSALGGFGLNMESPPSPTDDPFPSAFSSASAGRILYDIFDPANEPFDQVALGLGPIFDVLTGAQRTTPALTTLGSFITALKARPGVNAAQLDTLVANRTIGSLVSDFGDEDSPLRDYYQQVGSPPITRSLPFQGAQPSNRRGQNHYLVFLGNGQTMTISAESEQDVAVEAFRQGQPVGSSDTLITGGIEGFTFSSLSGATYVLVVTGFGTRASYTASVTIQ